MSAASGFWNGVNLGEHQHDRRNVKERDEREAKLQTLINSGLPPEKVQQGIRDIYGQDAPALQRHVENLFRRVAGKQPQQAQAPMRAADLAGLEAQGTTPEQRQEDRFKANTDYSNQAGLQYEQQSAQQKQQRDFALIDQYVTDPEQNKSLKQAYVQRVAEGTARPSADQQKRSDYQALVASGQVPKDAQGNPLSYEAWVAYSTAQGRAAGTASSPLKVGSFGEFVTSQFGPTPTPEQILKARSQWSQAAAGTTTGTHVIAVPQPDNTIKYYQVTTTSSKNFPGAGSSPAAAPATAPPSGGSGQPAPQKHPSSNPASNLPKSSGIPKLTGDIRGGKMTPEQKKQQELAGDAKRGLAIMKSLMSPNDPAANYSFLMTFIGLSYAAVRGARLNRAEIERAAVTRSLPDTLQNAYDLYVQKKELTPEQKQNMLNTVYKIESTYHNWAYARDENGKRHKAEADQDGRPLTPLPKGWTLEGQDAATANQSVQ